VRKTALIALIILSLAAYAPATCLIDFITESIPDQQVGHAFSVTLQVCCGTPPYTFSLAFGSFPPGVTMNSSGTISGTPTASGTYTPCITVTDSVGCHVTRCYEITVNP